MSATKPAAPVALVTGIGGFTGAWIRPELERAGYRVVGTHLADAPSGDRVLDIEDAEACRDVVADIAPQFVLHLAGISFVPQSDPSRLYAANVVGTTNLLDALTALPLRPSKIVLASSANVYGSVEGDAIDETREPRPANHYAVSKLAMEKMATTYFDELPIIIARPFNYTGAGQSDQFLIPKIVSHFARRERTIELGNLDVERDFSDVEVVASIYRRLLESDLRSDVVNICSGRASSLRTIVALMEDIAGYRIDVRTNDAFARKNDVRRLVGATGTLRDAVGDVQPTPLRTLLQKIYENLRQRDEQPSSR